MTLSLPSSLQWRASQGLWIFVAENGDIFLLAFSNSLICSTVNPISSIIGSVSGESGRVSCKTDLVSNSKASGRFLLGSSSSSSSYCSSLGECKFFSYGCWIPANRGAVCCELSFLLYCTFCCVLLTIFRNTPDTLPLCGRCGFWGAGSSSSTDRSPV